MLRGRTGVILVGIDVTGNTPSDPSGPVSWLDTMQNSAGALGDGLASGFSGIVNGIGNSLRGVSQGGIFSSIDEASQHIRDGQEDLESRADLLSPLLDYGSVSMPSGQPTSGTGFLPFSRQIGPIRGIELFKGSSTNDHGIKFLEKGLWDIRMQCTASWLIAADGLVEVSLNVYPPQGGTPFSTQKSIFYSSRSGIADGASEQTHVINSSVVVPAPGYFVLVFVNRCAPQRGWLGGPAWSRLTAQHISREVDGSWDDGSGNSDVPE